jgi:hypothetical protein
MSSPANAEDELGDTPTTAVTARDLARVLEAAAAGGQLDPTTGAVQPPPELQQSDEQAALRWATFLRDLELTTSPSYATPQLARRSLSSWRKGSVILFTCALVIIGTGFVFYEFSYQSSALMSKDTRATTVEEPQPTEPLARGIWWVKHDHPDVAIDAFSDAAKTDKTGRAAEWLAFCHARTSTHPMAIKYADQAEKAGRKTAAVYANRAAAKLFGGDNAGAANDAAEAIRIDADCTPAKLTRGLAVYKLEGRGPTVSRDALAVLEDAIPGNEGHAGMWASVAEARVRVVGATPDDHDRAINAIRQALRAGGKKEAVGGNKAIKAALERHPQWDAVLATPAELTPAGIEAHFVRPETI